MSNYGSVHMRRSKSADGTYEPRPIGGSDGDVPPTVVVFLVMLAAFVGFLLGWGACMWAA